VHRRERRDQCGRRGRGKEGKQRQPKERTMPAAAKVAAEDPYNQYETALCLRSVGCTISSTKLDWV
jgi:hypothetical protein